ncbi:hypothetical protein [Gordonia sp. NPDC003376]
MSAAAAQQLSVDTTGRALHSPHDGFFIAVTRTPVAFRPDARPPAPDRESPVILDCADLAAAQRRSHRLPATTPDGHPVVPVLQALAVTPHRSRSDSGTGVQVLDAARSVASLAIDLRLIGIARGLLVVAPHIPDIDRLREEIVDELRHTGHPTRCTIAGWVLPEG